MVPRHFSLTTHHDKVGHAASRQLLHHCKCLLHGLRLIDQHLPNVAAHPLRMEGVHRMLHVDKRDGAIHLLHLTGNSQRQGGLAAGFAAINLNHTSSWDTPAQRNIQGGDAGGDELYLVQWWCVIIRTVCTT